MNDRFVPPVSTPGPLSTRNMTVRPDEAVADSGSDDVATAAAGSVNEMVCTACVISNAATVLP